MPNAAEPAGLALIVRRIVRAPPARLFALWTEPAELMRWWGPAGATCPEAAVDLRVGGAYRIANRFADGRVVWIAGTFERVEPPRRLDYSWRLEPDGAAERVSVRFEPRGGGTEIVVLHERIADAALRASHEAGWHACLAGLERAAA